MNSEPIQNLVKDFSNLLENTEDSDIKIRVGEEPDIKEFKAHSIILSARSFYFKAALSSRWARRENGIIIFDKPNISPSVFEILITYIYTGSFSYKNEVSLLDIFIAADEIQLFEISQQVEKSLLEIESAWKFPDDFITICKHDNFTNLYQTALDIICKNPKIIFESNDFLEMQEDILIRLLKCDGLRLQEIEIWDYLIKWGIENTESILDNDLTKWTQTDFEELEKVLHNCISHIRFYELSFNELRLVESQYKNILPNNLLDETYQYLSDPDKRDTLPKRVSAYPFNSDIIDAKDAALIASWIDNNQGMPYHFKSIPFEFKLIYRAKHESFSIDKFHKSCDHKGPTVVIIKIRNSKEIIGGYNPLDWYGNCLMKTNSDTVNDYNKYKFKTTSKSFIFSLFSLSHGAIPRLSHVSSKKEAIVWCKARGPCFGFQDLWIEHNNSQRFAVGKCKRNSYEKRIINKDTFEIEEYEVFQIIYKTFSLRILFNRIFKSIIRFIVRIFAFIVLIFKKIFGFIVSMFKKIFGFTVSMVKTVFEFPMLILTKVFGFIIEFIGTDACCYLFWGMFIILSYLATLIFIFVKVNDPVRIITASASATASLFFITLLVRKLTQDMYYDRFYKTYKICMIFLYFFIISFHLFSIFEFISGNGLTQILAVSSFAAAIIVTITFLCIFRFHSYSRFGDLIDF